MWYVSSNRDESRYEDPDRFDVTRNAEHQAFGAGGRHFCLGTALARLELRILFEETLARFPRHGARRARRPTSSRRSSTSSRRCRSGCAPRRRSTLQAPCGRGGEHVARRVPGSGGDPSRPPGHRDPRLEARPGRRGDRREPPRLGPASTSQLATPVAPFQLAKTAIRPPRRATPPRAAGWRAARSTARGRRGRCHSRPRGGRPRGAARRGRTPRSSGAIPSPRRARRRAASDVALGGGKQSPRVLARLHEARGARGRVEREDDRARVVAPRAGWPRCRRRVSVPSGAQAGVVLPGEASAAPAAELVVAAAQLPRDRARGARRSCRRPRCCGRPPRMSPSGARPTAFAWK